MKSMYFIYYVENNKPFYNGGHSAQIESNSPLNALKQWYNYINAVAGEFKNFTYHAEEIPLFESQTNNYIS